MKCGSCGTELERDAKFCHICGQPAPAQAPEAGGFCPSCGARLPKVAVFCPRCGAALSEAVPRQSAAPADTSSAATVRVRHMARPEEPLTPAKKQKKKKKGSGAGGILLVILMLLLIAGCLGAVLFVEASTRGQTVVEYFSAAVGAGSAEDAKWSDMEAAAPEAGQEEKPQDGLVTKDVCRIYLELLKERQGAIERYDWQQTGRDMPTRQVVLCDVCGDVVPELIWVEATDDENVSASTLNVAGIRDGAAVILCSASWDIQAGGGFCYYLFQEKGAKTLYSFSACGEESWTQRYTAYVERDGGLAADVLLESVISVDWESENNERITAYTREGAEVTSEEWIASVENLLSETGSVLMYNVYAGVFPEEFVAENGCPAMSCGEAIAFLTDAQAAVS